MYDAFDDPYCYKDTSVLKNRAGLRTQIELEKFETFHVTQRSDEQLPAGRYSYSHYRAVHRHLFQDVYFWAGRIRSVRVSKGGNLFCFPEYIDTQMHQLFDWLADENYLRDLPTESFASKAARFMGGLNAIHPFREGNGRTQNVFLSLLAGQAGHPLDFERLDPPEFLQAMVASFLGDEQPLAGNVRRMIRRP